MALTRTHKYNTRSKTKVAVVEQVNSSSESVESKSNINTYNSEKKTRGKRASQTGKSGNKRKKQKVTKNQTIKNKGKQKLEPLVSSVESTTTIDVTNTKTSKNANKKQMVIKNQTKNKKDKKKSGPSTLAIDVIEDDYDINNFTSLPPEILRKILLRLRINDLCNLVLVNKKVLNIVQSQPIWAKVLTKNNKKSNKKHDDMFLVLKYMQRICDRCHKFGKPSGSAATVAINKHYHRNHQLQLCLSCRRHYFKKHPENTIKIAKKGFQDEIPNEEQNINNINIRITKYRAMNEFKLTESQLLLINCSLVTNPYGRNFSAMHLYKATDVIRISILIHGGYYGLLAQRKKSNQVAEKRLLNAQLKHNT